MTPPDPKRYGYKLPLEALGGVCIKVSIEFPDKLEYRAAFSGAINMLGKWFQWDHTQADYQDIPDLNVEVAQVWSGVLAAATWEECMTFCEQLIACLTDDTDTQEALANLIETNDAIRLALKNSLMSNPDFLREMQTQITQGNKLSPTEVIAPIGSNCDKDQLWAGMIGLVQQMNRNNEDFLEQMEVLTNIIERVTDLIRAIPVFETLPFDDVINFVNTLFSDITENYLAEYTTEYENTLACELFCLALTSDTCYLSFDQMYNVFRDRLLASFTVESALVDVIQFLASGTWSGSQVADFMFMFQMQCIRSASKFLAINLLSLQKMFDVGADEPNTGWEALCTDCACPTFGVNTNTSGVDGADSGIVLNNGISYHITATGTFTYSAFLPPVGPNGNVSDHTPGTIYPTANDLRLIGKIGSSGSWFALGADTTITADSTGVLFMTVNDIDNPVNFADNAGTLDVEVCVS